MKIIKSSITRKLKRKSISLHNKLSAVFVIIMKIQTIPRTIVNPFVLLSFFLWKFLKSTSHHFWMPLYAYQIRKLYDIFGISVKKKNNNNQDLYSIQFSFIILNAPQRYCCRCDSWLFIIFITILKRLNKHHKKIEGKTSFNIWPYMNFHHHIWRVFKIRWWGVVLVVCRLKVFFFLPFPC